MSNKLYDRLWRNNKDKLLEIAPKSYWQRVKNEEVMRNEAISDKNRLFEDRIFFEEQELQGYSFYGNEEREKNYSSSFNIFIIEFGLKFNDSFWFKKISNAYVIKTRDGLIFRISPMEKEDEATN